MGGTTGTEARLVQRIPRAAGAEHEEDGIHRLSILDAGPMAPQGVRFARREQRLDALPQLVRQTPITVGFLGVVMHQCGSYRRACCPTGYHQIAYWDRLVEAIRAVPWVSFEHTRPYAGPSSPLDDSVAFTVSTSDEELVRRRDGIAMDLLAYVFFAMNWPAMAQSRQGLAIMVRTGNAYNLWCTPNALRE